MAESGVLVSIVEPGGYRSRLREKVVMHRIGKAPGDAGSLTDEEAQQLARMRGRNAQLKEPDEVAAAVLHALFAEQPKARYLVVPNEEEALVTMRSALRRVAQLNADQPYSYSPEELTRMLEEAMAGQ
jgi:hypothetical protein